MDIRCDLQLSQIYLRKQKANKQRQIWQVLKSHFKYFEYVHYQQKYNLHSRESSFLRLPDKN